MNLYKYQISKSLRSGTNWWTSTLSVLRRAIRTSWSSCFLMTRDGYDIDCGLSLVTIVLYHKTFSGCCYQVLTTGRALFPIEVPQTILGPLFSSRDGFPYSHNTHHYPVVVIVAPTGGVWFTVFLLQFIIRLLFSSHNDVRSMIHYTAIRNLAVAIAFFF